MPLFCALMFYIVLIFYYFSQVVTVSNELKRNDKKLKEVGIIEKILRLVDSKFNYIIVTIEETKDLEDITIEQFQGGS